MTQLLVKTLRYFEIAHNSSSGIVFYEKMHTYGLPGTNHVDSEVIAFLQARNFTGAPDEDLSHKLPARDTLKHSNSLDFHFQPSDGLCVFCFRIGDKLFNEQDADKGLEFASPAIVPMDLLSDTGEKFILRTGGFGRNAWFVCDVAASKASQLVQRLPAGHNKLRVPFQFNWYDKSIKASPHVLGHGNGHSHDHGHKSDDKHNKPLLAHDGAHPPGFVSGFG